MSELEGEPATDPAELDEPAPPMERPMPLTVMAVALGALGVLAVTFGVAVVLAAFASLIIESTALPALTSVIGIFGLLTGAVGAGCLAFAYGAWHLLRWAWKLGLALALLIALSSGPFGIAIGGLMAFYLLRQDIRQAFGRS